MPKEYFEKQVLMDFENIQLNGPGRAHEYLEKMYGDYMQLPPEGKRHTHIINMYWK